MEGDTLLLQLLKISGATTKETLEEVLQTLWNTRKIGLSSQDKSRILSLLNLVSLEELDPVLACLRCLIRSCLRGDSVDNNHNISMLFPPDLSPDLQHVILHSLLKFQIQWKEEASKEDKCLKSRTRVSYPAIVGLPSSSAAKKSSSMWPRHDESTTCSNHSVIDSSTTNADARVSHLLSSSLPLAEGSSHNLMQGVLPCLKSMTWTVQNHNQKPDNKVASISLKLQDYSKYPSGETEVKFELTRDTLDAMLRSMADISEQLSNIVEEPSSGQLQKAQ
ncbi:hypothetical protein Scep_013718 [Stephania cephalantha]|uniref:COMM domain-containing protein n=1 Tax=Stephania cephalantha TaxID=152367 RepID=A0AAP0IZN5_9MAGN